MAVTHLFQTERATYTYEVYPLNQTWNAVAGNYIFAKRQADGRFHLLYVGETNDFSDRLPNHEKRGAAINLGATHILAHINFNEALRKAEEADLIASFRPPLNVLLK